jgi:hypothetical protein
MKAGGRAGAAVSPCSAQDELTEPRQLAFDAEGFQVGGAGLATSFHRLRGAGRSAEQFEESDDRRADRR